ncbi:hypothetical protein [Bacillus rhizoplanae]|uniref:hypothetical protein n=1 Tax=Bacillus rhizoplanae TaxID=2880966 RepID=UPI003D21EB0E
MKSLMKLRKIWANAILKFRRAELRITRAQLSGNDSFIDIRYSLSRPDLIKGRIPIYLIDEKNGQKFQLMNLPKLGEIRTKHSKYQTTGILLFRNQNGIVKANSRVTVVFGSLVAKHIEVKAINMNN